MSKGHRELAWAGVARVGLHCYLIVAWVSPAVSASSIANARVSGWISSFQSIGVRKRLQGQTRQWQTKMGGLFVQSPALAYRSVLVPSQGEHSASVLQEGKMKSGIPGPHTLLRKWDCASYCDP